MVDQPTKSIFINYRRRDSSLAALWLAETIERTFGNTNVFVDTESVQIGAKWAIQIEQSLRLSSVLIVVIGPGWLRVDDEYGRRRLDDSNDWVRKEIVYALENNVTIIPLLVSGATLPNEDGLPSCLIPLIEHQSLELRDDKWQHDIPLLVERLEQIGFERTSPHIELPPKPIRPKAKPLTSEELDEALKRLPNWKLVNRVGEAGERRVELMRKYQFASFEDASHFMATATRRISKVEHHPHWENIWKTIVVWLSTWDIGHKPSAYDVEFAIYLDELFRDYEY